MLHKPLPRHVLISEYSERPFNVPLTIYTITFIKKATSCQTKASIFMKNVYEMDVFPQNTLHKKWSFLLKISSVHVTKSEGTWIWSHLLKQFLIENFIFRAVFPADLVTFTEEILKGKVYFLCFCAVTILNFRSGTSPAWICNF